MKNKQLPYLQSREKLRIKKLMQLKNTLTCEDYFNMKSIFADDYLYFSSFELFMNKRDKIQYGSYFVHEWLMYLLIDKTIKKWLCNNECLDLVSIVIPSCGSGMVTQLVIEYLLVSFKKIYPNIDNQLLLEQIIKKNIVSWDANEQALQTCYNRIYGIFNIEPVLKNTTTILEKGKFDIILGTIPSGDLLSIDFKNYITSCYDNVSIDFIEWSLQSLKQSGEVCFVLPSDITLNELYKQWRKIIYEKLQLHTVINLNPYTLKDNNTDLMILSLNNQTNYTIEYNCLNDFSTHSHIPVNLFYNLDNSYHMLLPCSKI